MRDLDSTSALPEQVEVRTVASARTAPLDHTLLGYPLACYQEMHHSDDATLAAELGIAPEELDALRACPRPWGDPYGVRLGRIAEAFGADPQTLATIVGIW
jgi:hypothetical protein